MLLLPTAWVNAAPRGQSLRNVHPEFLIRARAMEFGVPIACASKSDQEGEYLEYVGQSRIVDAEGNLVCDAPPHGEKLIVGQISPGRPRAPSFSPADVSRLNSAGERFKPTAPAAPIQVPAGMVMSKLEN
jgi:predicted amidohydrolase